ncbi:hypothetical protein BTJ40_14320 [Microbulbifer sp. A4B17]|uniref:condensation domain-containing protein n=1 Tax=Microbulbifer sp. A4B17 TaxID=359370 RepID=UPI000D52CC8D|nr:hypothetical protein BTJ40_14320 [Microbulbifer sp. A4B17]
MGIRHLSDAHVASFLRQFGSALNDLLEDQLLSLSLLRTGEGEFIFLTKCHHIISDGISLSLLWSEVLSRSPSLYVSANCCDTATLE